MSRLLSSHEIIQNQLKLVDTKKPVNNWKKHADHGKTLVGKKTVCLSLTLKKRKKRKG